MRITPFNAARTAPQAPQKSAKVGFGCTWKEGKGEEIQPCPEATDAYIGSNWPDSGIPYKADSDFYRCLEKDAQHSAKTWAQTYIVGRPQRTHQDGADFAHKKLLDMYCSSKPGFNRFGEELH